MFLLATLIAVAILTDAANAAEHGYRTIYRFRGGNDGWFPTGVPAVDKNGNLYGTTIDGGKYNQGTIYELIAPQTRGGKWTKTVLYDVTSQSPGYPFSVIVGQDGGLYGTGESAQNCGFLWKLVLPAFGDGVWKYAVLYTLNGTSDGCAIQGHPVLDGEGNLYGATELGGDLGCEQDGCGTVFELKRPTTKGGKWHFHVLHAFTGNPDGAEPFAGLTFDQEGNLYGTTWTGGTAESGTVYRMSPPKNKGQGWSETVLHSFTERATGVAPGGPLTFDSSGNIYGTTISGGDLNCQGGAGCGLVFELTPPTDQADQWSYATLYAFQGGNDGVDPEGYIVFDSQGNLYSTTYVGGQAQAGTAFRLEPTGTDSAAWMEAVLHWFPESKKDGYDPVGGLTWGKWRNLYGVASVGGNPGCGEDGCGTVFELQP